MLLYLIRHGETSYNLENRIQGQLDTELTELGIKQAKSAADSLKNIKFDALYSSDLARAVQSAEEICKLTGNEIIPDRLLRERNFGVLQGLTVSDAAKKYPAAANAWRNNDPAAKVPEGESTLDVVKRCADFLHIIEKKHGEDEVICVVCHGGTLRALVAALTQMPAEYSKSFKFSNAGISIFQLGKRKAVVMLNDTSHTKSLQTPKNDSDYE